MFLKIRIFIKYFAKKYSSLHVVGRVIFRSHISCEDIHERLSTVVFGCGTDKYLFLVPSPIAAFQVVCSGQT